VTITLPANGAGANAGECARGDAAPVVFPPVLPKAVRNQDAIRNESHAKTAHIA
jgi:hypothetical protein